MTLDQVLKSPTKETLRTLLLSQLAGRGWVKHIGSGTGTVTLPSGTPTGDFDLVLKVSTAGELGVAQVQVSLDLGATFGVATLVPGSGTLVLAGTGVTAQFANSASGATPSFRVGDTYSAEIRKNGFPVTSWQPFSTPLAMVENDAEALEDMYVLVRAIAAGGYLSTAEGAWVDLNAEDFYGLLRTPATFAEGTVTLSDPGSLGPFTLAAGLITVSTAAGQQFVNKSSVTIPLGGSVSAVVKAVSGGAAFNVANSTIVAVLTSLPGVTVANPDPGSGTWLTLQGTDEESDELLRQRCRSRWPALGTGTTGSVYESWAKEASTSVTKATARASSTTPGQVTLVLAGNAGAVAPGVVTAVDAYVKQRQPLAIDVVVSSAAAVVVTVTGDVTVSASLLTSAMLEVALNLQQLIADTPIGGTVYLAAIVEAVMAANGVINVVLTLPAADVALTTLQVATLTQTLTFVAV